MSKIILTIFTAGFILAFIYLIFSLYKNYYFKLLSFMRKPLKCCKNCKFWILSEYNEYRDSRGSCEKSDKYAYVSDNYLCGKFRYCDELLKNKQTLKIIPFENKAINKK